MYNTQLGAGEFDLGAALRTGIISELSKQPEVQTEARKAGYATALDQVAGFMAKYQTPLMLAGAATVAFLVYKMVKK